MFANTTWRKVSRFYSQNFKIIRFTCLIVISSKEHFEPHYHLLEILDFEIEVQIITVITELIVQFSNKV